jgi:hypothetical protein
MTQFELGEKLAVSARTILRWERRQGRPAPFQISTIVALAKQEDEELARQFVEACREEYWLNDADMVAEPMAQLIAPTVESAAPAVAHAVAKTSIDSVLLAAAAAADITPRPARAAVVAAFVRARELGLSVEAVVEMLERAAS